MKISRKILALLIISFILLLFVNNVAAVSDTYGNVLFHPFTMDPDNTTCVHWTENGMETRNCDPVNLLFPDQTVNDVYAELASRGWTTSGFGSNQLLHFDDEGTFLNQDLQLYRNENATSRYHVRLWQAPGNFLMTFGAVHHESGFLVHTIDMSWEESEAFIAGILCGSDFICEQSGLLFEQYNIQGSTAVWRGWENSGSATVIKPVTSSGPATMHIGDLDGGSDNQGKYWIASVTINVHDASSNLVANVTVDGNWNGISGQTACVTNSSGTCTVVSDFIPKKTASVDFNVVSITHGTLSYSATENHDPDGDSDGHTITVPKDAPPSPPQAPPPGATTIHVSDLDGTTKAIGNNRWKATVNITVHDDNENSLADATITGQWTGDYTGAASCITDGDGQCSLSTANLGSNTIGVTFTVSDISYSSLSYESSSNHDDDGDSNGTSIDINRP